MTPRHPRRRWQVEKSREHRDCPIPLRRVLDPTGSPLWLQETGYRDSRLSDSRRHRREGDGADLPGLYGKETPTDEEIALAEDRAPQGALRDAIAALRFAPDVRAGWIDPATGAALAVHDALRLDAVYSLSPPVSSHAIASRIARHLRIPWVADLREAWSGNPVGLVDAWNRSRILRRASSLAPPPSFDTRDADRRSLPASIRRIPVLAHAGPVGLRGRDPVLLLDAVQDLLGSPASRPLDLRIRLLGARDRALAAAVGARALGRVVTIEPTVPWEISLQTQAEADGLLVLLGPGERDRIPDRFLEALSAGRPVFAVGPPGSRLQRLLRETNLGSYHEDASSLGGAIVRWLAEGAPREARPKEEGVAPFRAADVATELAEGLDRMLGGR